VGDARQPAVDVDDHHFPNGMIGVRDYCGDGNQSLSSYTHLVARELAGPPIGGPHADIH